MSEDLRYPVGKFSRDPNVDAVKRAALIGQLAEAPARLAAAVHGLDDTQLDTPYRPGGWTVRQVAHHVPDSHMNAYVRMKLCVTENSPTIKPYDEAAWARLPDGQAGGVEGSLALLEHLHERWVRFMRALPAEAFGRTLIHPESGLLSLDALVAMYAWHGQHHTAHVTSLRQRSGWS